jgi:hypothetical protein
MAKNYSDALECSRTEPGISKHFYAMLSSLAENIGDLLGVGVACFLAVKEKPTLAIQR